jgi:NAD(P)H-hydrate epimerase
MVTGGAETEEGTLAYTAWETMKERMGEFSAILCGPGLTQEDDSARIVSDLIRNSTVPLVLDADALNVLKGKPEVLKQATQPVLLTPHPGELARLMGTTVTEIQQDRYASVRRAGHTTGCTVLLKGAGTLVADGDAPLRVNLTGNPGMASGGSGDVLAGLVTGFVGQGLTCADAASAAAYVHGRAGDIGALIFSQTALCAGAVINCLASALQEILPR